MTDAVPGDTQRVILADEGRFTDLTARLAAADAGWCLTYGDERADPAYIRFLAAQGDAFEGVASPAAPADDEAATVERVRRAIHDNLCACDEPEEQAGECCHASAAEWNKAATAALVALREGQQK